MSDKAIRDELTKLREQVAELQSARTNAPSPQEQQVPGAAPQDLVTTRAEEADQDTVFPEGAEEKDTEEQIRDFVNALDQEIKSTNPMTVLVVFSLGVVIGRLLPR
jgi:ElaB/YqjD/DUF883 family membrane-anchored ribosome-binding protein